MPINTEHLEHHINTLESSLVNGQGHAGSDLDLVIINPQNPNEPQSKIADLRQALHDSNLPMTVDLHDWARIPKSFQIEIQKQYEIIC